MVSSKATTVAEYLASLPADRRKAVQAVRKVVKKALPKGYREGMQYGMISWFVPLSRYADTYNGQPLAIASLASQKRYLSLYLHGVYADPALAKRFEKRFRASGKKLNMGKSCVRFETVEDLDLDAIAEALGAVSVEDYVAIHEEVHGSNRQVRRRKSTKKIRKKPVKAVVGKKPRAKSAKAKKKQAAKKAKKKPAKKASRKTKPAKKAAKRKSPTTRRSSATKRAKKRAR